MEFTLDIIYFTLRPTARHAGTAQNCTLSFTANLKCI